MRISKPFFSGLVWIRNERSSPELDIMKNHTSICIAFFEEEEEIEELIADVDESNHWDFPSPYSDHEPLVHLLHSKCTFSRMEDEARHLMAE